MLRQIHCPCCGRSLKATDHNPEMMINTVSGRTTVAVEVCSSCYDSQQLVNICVDCGKGLTKGQTFVRYTEFGKPGERVCLPCAMKQRETTKSNEDTPTEDGQQPPYHELEAERDQLKAQVDNYAGYIESFLCDLESAIASTFSAQREQWGKKKK